MVLQKNIACILCATQVHKINGSTSICLLILIEGRILNKEHRVSWAGASTQLQVGSPYFRLTETECSQAVQ